MKKNQKVSVKYIKYRIFSQDNPRFKEFLLGLCLSAFFSLSVAATSVKPISAQAEPAPLASGMMQFSTIAPGLVRVADGRLLAPDIARIVTRGELVVAMRSADTPPFFYMKKGELVGLEVDLAKAIAKELKVQVRFERSAQNFNEVVDVVALREADLGLSKLSRTLARAQVISFTDPYLKLNHALILNRVKFAELARNRDFSTVIRSFNGTLGVIQQSSFEYYAQKNFPQAKIRGFNSWEDVIFALKKGEIMGAYRDELEIKRILKSDPTIALTLRTVTFKDLEDSLGIAVGIQDITLLAFVNQFLADSTDKMTIEKVLNAID